MNSQLWKTVFDNLDEDIVNSAAERFGKVNFTGENPGDYPADNSPTEYKYSADKGKNRLKFLVGMGSAAAAAAAVTAGVFVLRGAGGPLEASQLLSGGISTSQSTAEEVLSTSESPVSYEQSSASEQLRNVIRTASGFDLAVFDEYFYGEWDFDGGASTLQLGYTPTGAFSHSAGAFVLEMGSDSDGGYMMAQTDFGYDVYFVPNDDPETLQYYHNVNVTLEEDSTTLSGITEEDSTLLSGIMEKDGELHDILGVDCAEYKRGAPLSSDNSLGYFGIERLAMEMGVTSDWLLNQDIQFEGGDAELWTRNVWFDGWDTVISLNAQTDYSVTLRMRYALAGNETKIQFFDVTFEKENNGSWFMSQIQTSPSLYFGTWEKDSYEVTRADLALFKAYFTGSWKDEDEETPHLTLIYTRDIFTPAEFFAGIREVGDGYAMYHVTAQGMRVYYIEKDNPEIMYLYNPDKDGFSEPDSCTAVYERLPGKDYVGSIRYSCLGLERYKLMHSDPDHISLAEAIDNALNDYTAETDWSASNYTSAMEGWDGYRIVEKSDSLVLFSYQRFNQEGESYWVTQELINDGVNWRNGEFNEGVLTGEDDRAPEEVDRVPVMWSEDQEIAEMAAAESEGVYDGR